MSDTKAKFTTVRLSAITFDESVYPRHAHDPALVQRYVACIEQIEAAGAFMSVSPDLKLLDGKHRWLAYKKVADGQDRDVKVFVHPVAEPREQLLLAATLNSAHGWQLIDEDKVSTARALHAHGYTYDEIAASLNVGKKRVGEWLHDVLRDQKEKRDRKIFDLWMACRTMEEIGHAVNCSKQTVSEVVELCQKKFHETKADKLLAEFADWDAEEGLTPTCNVWRASAKTNAIGIFGNSEARWTERLTYLYTQPFDVVVDLFSGGGATIDVCKKRFRRYWVSDRKPIVERESEIQRWDIAADGLPPMPRWQDVRLVFLDPPYWRQARGEYSKDATDLANMSLATFTLTLAKLINGLARKLSGGAMIALMIAPSRDDDKNFVDHLLDLAPLVRLRVAMRVQAPYENSQLEPQDVEWARRNHTLCILGREIVVWRVERHD